MEWVIESKRLTKPSTCSVKEFTSPAFPADAAIFQIDIFSLGNFMCVYHNAYFHSIEWRREGGGGHKFIPPKGPLCPFVM